MIGHGVQTLRKEQSKEIAMSNPQQIAQRAREVSLTKTSLLRVVVSERVSSANASASSNDPRSIEARNIKR